MTAILCRVGSVREPQDAVSLPLALASKEPPEYFLTATAGASSQLSLTMDYSRFDKIGTAPEANAYYLHRALADLTGNSASAKCVKRIGLVLADRYADEPSAFGYMFDTGFDPSIGDVSFNAVAREGCAVFLDAIRDQRPDLADYETEVGFTTVHELGHVFNLWHVEDPSFMAQSKHAAPYGTGAFAFLPEHRAFLETPDSPYVCPGGSRWDDRGDLVVPAEPPHNATGSPRVALRIGLRQAAFWRFEPIQLDVSVSCARGVAEVRIPNVIDPGYDAFVIWIEAPDGTRRRYRPPVIYCDAGKIRRIRHGEPFTRDIPLFGQSGGYTFRQAGDHRVYCTLKLPDGSVVRSNVVDAHVKPALRTDRYRRVAALLTQRPHAQALFYRSASRPSVLVDPLEEAAREFRGTPVAASIRYSLGRALVTAASGRRSATRRRHESTAARLLKTAQDSGQLSASRERRVEETLAGMESR